jgi:hypothetical protein
MPFQKNITKKILKKIFRMIDLEKINRLPPDIKKEFMKTLVQYDEKKKIHKIQNDFYVFC